ncbi:MAG TPA: hypothetical protein VNR61_19125 [Niallia sp.]|nr:hypothetical protein [Niallia sp.]
MSSITTYGYNKIQDYLVANVTYLELQDDQGNAIKRYTTSNGLTITNSKATQTITYEVVATGDAAFLNKTVAQSVLFDVATNGSSIATETFSPFTFESAEDELTVKHNIQVPQL